MKKILFFILIAFFLLPKHVLLANNTVTPDFKDNTYSHQVIMSENDITDYNQAIIDSNNSVFDLLEEKDSITKNDIVAYINKLSTKPIYDRYDENRELLQDDYYLAQIKNSDTENISGNILYGITVKRTALTKYPSKDKAYSSYTSPYDRFLETTLYVGEPLLILHESQDGHFYFVCMYNYMGWVDKNDIALCSELVLSMYIDCDRFVTITSGHTNTLHSDIQLDVGSRFPLIGVSRNYHLKALIPGRKEDGSLYFIKDTINRLDGHKGYVDYTKSNLITQALSLLGEPYGWGGDKNARDCSSYVMDTFRTFGIYLPRNTGDQEIIPGNITFPTNISDYNLLKTGSLLFMNGHVMIYLGIYDGIHYMIHDTPGYYINQQFFSTDGVTISPVLIDNSKGISYVDLIKKAIFVQ